MYIKKERRKRKTSRTTTRDELGGSRKQQKRSSSTKKTMRAHHQMSLFFILSLLTFLQAHHPTIASVPRIQDLISRTNLRRILHQPLFPEGSSPPPALVLPPPPPPPAPVFPGPDQPFFPEVPNGQTPNQANQSPPPPPSSANSRAVPNPMATQPAKPAKKVAIAISVGIVTLGMLSGLAFYLYKLRVKSPGESQKLVGENSQRNTNDDSRMPPSTFLYIGTIEPSSRQTVSESNGANESPYHKLNSIKRSDRYRPSPELQPLPPLSKPPLPPSNNSPPAMSSSDEESHDFYTPHGSSATASIENGYYTPNVKQSHSSKDSSLTIQPRIEARRSTSPVPHSKRTSPRSRLSVSSSPDTKSAVSLTNQPPATSPPRPPQPPTPTAAPQIEYSPPTIAYAPRRAKFSAPPPPPDMSRFHSVDNHSQQKTKISIPPPPPPPPPQMSAFSTESRATLRDSQSLAVPRAMNLIPKPIPGIVKIKPIEEANDGTNSSDRIDADDVEGSKPKLKPLHWDKVRATSDRATVWDQLKSSSFQLNEDVMESLFGCNSASSVKKEETRRSNLPPVEKENRVLDPKKSQNIAILLRALNVTRDEVCEALLEGNPEGLGAELLETLVKMAPTKEEEIKLRDYRGEMSKLGTAERFLKAVLDIPFAFKRVEAMLYRANFDMEVKYLRNSFQTLEAASEELKNSRLFLKLLEAVLRTGNRMNIGTNRGEARAFKLDTLLKLVDIKGTDGKTTLLHFVVQEIIRSEGTGSDPRPEDLANKMNSRLNEQSFKKQGLQVVGGLGRELGNVKKAAGMDSDVLSSYVSKLEMGLEKVRLVIQCEKPNMQVKFFESMKIFLKEAEAEIAKVKDYERKALTLVKEVTEYFHGDTTKEGAYPLRIFMIVRDFLSILDHVCKEVGQMQDKTLVGSARSFRIPPTASLPVLNRYNVRQDRSSDEESSSP